MMAIRDSRGFTMVEVLISLSLMMVVIATLMATFYGGIQVWERVTCRGSQTQFLHLALDEMRKDIQGYQTFDPIPFEGKYNIFSFPRMVPSIHEKAEGHLEPGRSGYYLDERNDVLCRSVHSYREVMRGRVKDECKVILQNVERVRFQYYEFSPDEGKSSWANSFASTTKSPLAIKAEIGYHDVCTEKRVNKEFVLSIPQSPKR